MHQVEYLLEVAMRDEKKGFVKKAIDMYTCAVELALKVVCIHVNVVTIVRS